MMRYIFFFTALALLFATSANAQFLTQSAEGKSSIPLPLTGVGLGVDIGKTEVSIGVNNYERVLRNKTNALLGLNLSVKSEEGLGNIFTSGDIVPASNFLGFGGWSFSNTNKILNIYTGVVNSVTAQEQRDLLNLFYNYREDIKNAIDRTSSSNQQAHISDSLRQALKDSIDRLDGPDKINIYLNSFYASDSNVVIFREQLRPMAQYHLENYKRIYNMTRAQYDQRTTEAFNLYMDSIVPRRATIFLLGGINAHNFTRFLQKDPVDLSKSFQDTLVRGWQIGLGLNVQIANFWLGATYSYVKKDNFINLKSKEYTLRTTDNLNNQALIGEKKITAYSGLFGKVAVNELNIDLVGDFLLSDTSRLLANLYLRGSLFSRDTFLLKNYTNIGTGLYFVGNKGKFLGGLYVELPDVNNNLEKAKPADEINIRPPLGKLSIGIVTKFNISSIFAWMNRPAKPD